MNARKRGYALLLCVGLILALFVSSAFLIHEADHDCSGEDCPICRTIALTTALMRTLCLAAARRLVQENRVHFALLERLRTVAADEPDHSRGLAEELPRPLVNRLLAVFVKPLGLVVERELA